MEKSHVEVRAAGEKGRGLYSLVDFAKDDIIFEEEPIVSCQFAWNEDYGYDACHHCLRPLETALENARRLSMNNNLTIPYAEECGVDKAKHVSCPTCSVKYCSEECRELAWYKYHKTLCLRKFEKDNSHPLEQLREMWKEFHYPPETSNIMLLVRIFAMIHQTEDKSAISNLIQQFCHPSLTEENIVGKFLSLKHSDQIDILREQLVKSIPTEYAPEWITPDGFKSLLVLVGMNGQGIGTSAVSDWVKNVEKMNLQQGEKQAIEKFIETLYESFDNAVGEFLNNEGCGLYCVQSSINHSCTPNAEIVFPNSNYRLAVRCLEDICAGDEICISYVSECILERSRHSRQKILRSHFFFDCKCRRCEEEMHQPDETSEEEMSETEESE